MQAKLPVYLIGAFGGCTAAIVDAIEGRSPKSLTREEQVSLDVAWRADQPAPEAGKLPRRSYANRVADFNQRVAAPAAINYQALVRDFAAAGVAGLSQHNGLSDDENRRLFVTPHTAEMVFLVLKGLRTLRASGRLRLPSSNS